MNVTNSFKNIFDKTSCFDKNDSWDVLEKKESAKLKVLHIINNGNEFHIIDNSAYKGIKDVTENRSNVLLDKDCDGVAFTICEEKKFLLLSELKSNLSTQEITKAFNQIIFTFLKLNMMLSLCQDYDLDKYNLVGIIACQPAKDEHQKEQIKDWANMLETRGSLNHREIELLTKLYTRGCLKINIGDTYMLKDKMIHEKIKNKKLHLYFAMADKHMDTSKTIDLRTLLQE